MFSSEGYRALTSRTVPLVDISTDQEAATLTQTRGDLSEDVVKRYAEALKDNRGGFKGHITLVPDGRGKYFIADGHHRVRAYQALRYVEVEAWVEEGYPDASPGELEQIAFEMALRANQDHGLMLNRRDQRKKTMMAILNPKMRELTQYQLAGVLGVSEGLVRTVAWELKSEKLIPDDAYQWRRGEDDDGEDDNGEPQETEEERIEREALERDISRLLSGQHLRTMGTPMRGGDGRSQIEISQSVYRKRRKLFDQIRGQAKGIRDPKARKAVNMLGRVGWQSPAWGIVGKLVGIVKDRAG